MSLEAGVARKDPDQLPRHLRSDFHRDGFVLLPAFFSTVEVSRLRARCESEYFSEGERERHNADVSHSPLAVNYPPSLPDIADLSSRLLKVVETLLDNEACHVNSKHLDDNEARIGGSWPWHQDYWYAYQAGFLFPDMVNSVVAIQRSSPEVDTLQVVKGSHKMGRLDHVLLESNGRVREDASLRSADGPVWIGADPLRVDHAISRLQIVDCFMDPGDVLMFHANCLHRSGQSCSQHPGRSLLCSCYRAAWNEPVQRA